METVINRRTGLRLAPIWAASVFIAVVGLGIGTAASGQLDVNAAIYLIVSAGYAGLGLLMAVRQPGNRVAWLLYVVATWLILEGAVSLRFGEPSSPPDPVEVADVLAIVWGNTGYFVGFLFPLILLFYIFPTGRFLSRRWSWAGWTAALLGPFALFAEGFQEEVGFDGADWTVVNPFGFMDNGGLSSEGILGAVFGVGFIVLGLGGLPAIIIRYRKADSQVRAQIKWVVYALLLMAVSLFITMAVGDSAPEWFASLLFLIMLTAAPISITIAITRYQLYEIDRLISRTVTYTLVATVLAALYVGLVTLITSLVPTQNALAVAGSTLAVAAMFNPLRKRIRHYVDQRFNRSAHQAEVVSERFAAKLREPLATHELAELWEQTVTDSFQPSAAGIWLSPEYTEDHAP